MLTWTGLLCAQDADIVLGNQNKSKDEIPTALAEYRRPDGYNPLEHRFKYSLKELQVNFSEKLMLDAEKEYNRILNVNSKGKWKPSPASLDRHHAPEWFQDIKFGMFVDWGPWAVGGWAVKRDEKHPMYPDWYEHRLDHDINCEKYHDKNWGTDFERDDLLPLFQAKRYQPEKLVDLAQEAGMKYLIPFCKHCSGYCLWSSAYTFRDSGDMIGKDLMEPLVKRCKEQGLKFGFYYCLQEWEYPIIGRNNELLYRHSFDQHGVSADNYSPYVPKLETWSMGKIPVRDYVRDYAIPLATEFIDKFDPDILWFDAEWDAAAEVQGSYDIAAYFYNNAEGRKEVAVNDRYGFAHGKSVRGFRGDFYTSEYGLFMPEDRKFGYVWEENRGISQSFGFNWQDTDENVITAKQFIDMFVDVVSRGGNLLLIVNLDAQGALPDIQERRLKEIGKWLNVNGEGIYSTRAYSVPREGSVCYTRSKDNKTVYAISLDHPGKELTLKSVQPAEGSNIYLLGSNEPLKWSCKDGITTIVMPASLAEKSDYAYTFKMSR
jgi:alpha-L-fucosidase